MSTTVNGLKIELSTLDDFAALVNDKARLAATTEIVWHIPKFTDGRAYSIAAQLRQDYGYTGRLRAVGDVLLDQLYLLKRAGFDAFDLRADQDESFAPKARAWFEHGYQASSDTAQPLWLRQIRG